MLLLKYVSMGLYVYAHHGHITKWVDIAVLFHPGNIIVKHNLLLLNQFTRHQYMEHTLASRGLTPSLNPKIGGSSNHPLKPPT